MTKFCAIGYIPAPSFAGAAEFYANITAWRHRHPLILFSEHKWDDETILLKASPEILVGERRHARSNLVWLTALRILRTMDYTHLLYVEQDCRVAQHEWDSKIFDEAFSDGVPFLAGSVVCHSMCSVSLQWTKLWAKWLSQYASSLFPPVCLGGAGIAEKSVPCMFLNGALGVYDLKLMLDYFAPQLVDGQTAAAAIELPAWDVHIGRILHERHGEGIFSGIVKHLSSVYSSYGDVQTSEAERLEMLVTGQCYAIHQVKGKLSGPLKEDDLRIPKAESTQEIVDRVFFPDRERSEWRTPTEVLPKQGSYIDVITYENNEVAGYFCCDNNWTIPGYPHDLYNDNIKSWRYAKSLPENDLRKEVGNTERLSPHDSGRNPETHGYESTEVTGGANSEENTRTNLEAGAGDTVLGRGTTEEISGSQTGRGSSEQTNARMTTVAPAFIPSMDLLIVTFAKDAEWLLYCLRSIRKFCTGFNSVVILVPVADKDAFAAHRKEFKKGFKWKFYAEKPAPLGFLDHMVQVCCAEEWCEADTIMHVDADCLFSVPTSPVDYLQDGKPILQIESFEVLKNTHAGRYHWKSVTDAALGISATHCTMTRHPGVFPRELYPLVRQHIAEQHKQPFEAYVLSRKPDFPQGYCEFGAIGAYAMHSATIRSRMHFVEGTQQPDHHNFVPTDGSPAPKNHILQGHSHAKGDPTNLDRAHTYGKSIPEEVNSHRKLAAHLGLV